MKRSVLLSIFDQAMISAFNLLLNFAFISQATPADFGQFVLILAGGFFAMSAQNALVVMPLNYLLPGRPAAEARAQLSMLTSANLVLTAIVVVISLGLAAYLGVGFAVLLGILAYMPTMLLREYARNLSIVEGRIGQTLLLDAMAIALSAGLVLALWQVLPPGAAALLGMAGGNAVALLIARARQELDLRRFAEHLAGYRNVWRETRWALQGALQNEVEARSYVFMVEKWRDAATLGMLQAGRVATSPLLLITTAWRRVARPRMVEDLYHGRQDAVWRSVRSGVLVIGGATLAYGLLLVVCWPLLDTYVFRNRYGNMSGIVACWWAYCGVVGMAGVAATLLEARRQFRELAAVGLGVAGLIVVLLAGLAFTPFDIEAVVLMLCGVHVLEVIACFLLIRGRPPVVVAPALAETAS